MPACAARGNGLTAAGQKSGKQNKMCIRDRSGTGKTFSSSTLARRLERLFAPELMLFFKVKPVILSFLHLKQCFGRRPGARTGTLQTLSLIHI